jgi:hypothetical protein
MHIHVSTHKLLIAKYWVSKQSRKRMFSMQLTNVINYANECLLSNHANGLVSNYANGLVAKQLTN